MTCIEGVPIAKALNELGYPAFVLRYRVRDKGRLPAPMDDLARAIREVADGNGARWKINTQGYSVWGFSAGGHLAASFGTDALGYKTYGLQKPTALILSYPGITMGEYTHEGSRLNLLGPTPTQAEIGAASVENLVTADYPPTFLWNSRTDEVLSPRNGEMLAAALKEKGVPHLFQQFPTGKHGCGLGKGTVCEPWFDMALKFWREAAEKGMD